MKDNRLGEVHTMTKGLTETIETRLIYMVEKKMVQTICMVKKQTVSIVTTDNMHGEDTKLIYNRKARVMK